MTDKSRRISYIGSVMSPEDRHGYAETWDDFAAAQPDDAAVIEDLSSLDNSYSIEFLEGYAAGLWRAASMYPDREHRLLPLQLAFVCNFIEKRLSTMN